MKKLLSLFCLILLSACGAPRALDASALSSASSGSELVSTAYRMSGNDKIRVIVFNEPTLSNEFIINSDGSLSFPLVGTINAAGKTTTELSNELAEKLGAGYLKNPKVSVEVLTFRPFYILGEVNKPGQYPYASGMTVLNAVATAQGFSYRAERRVAYIRRAGSPKEIAVRITPDLEVAPGDTIRVGERYF